MRIMLNESLILIKKHPEMFFGIHLDNGNKAITEV